MYAPTKNFITNLLDNSQVGIVILNSSFEIIFLSKFIEELTGFSEDEINGAPLERLFPSNPEIIRAGFAYGDIPSTIKFYKPLKCKDNSVINTRIRLVKERDDQGLLLFIIYVKDNTAHQLFRKDVLRKALTIEQLSRSRKIRDGKLQQAVYEILHMSSIAMPVERVNAWLFDTAHSKISCIGSYDSGENILDETNDLARVLIPRYFSLFETERIIITIDALTSPITSELVDTYLKPNHIHSLMDIPIRVEGEIAGVVCFEHKHKPREWNIGEQTFGLMVAQMVSLALETQSKKAAHDETSIALEEQQILLKELRSRLKNNFAVLSDLISIQTAKAKDDFHRGLLDALKKKVNSIAETHQLFYESESYKSIHFKEYINKILKKLSDSFNSKAEGVRLTKNIENCTIDVSYAIPLSLIMIELVTNSYKHAFKRRGGEVKVSFGTKGSNGVLKIQDNGKGFVMKENGSLGGLDIVRSLAHQIEGEINFSNKKGSIFMISFPLVAA